MLSMGKRAELFEAKLSEYDLVTLAYICKRDVETKVDKVVDRKIFTINQALETSFAAALFQNTGLTISEVEEIIRTSNDFMKDSEEFITKYKEDWIMEINKIKPNIKEECLKLLNKNISGQNEAVKELKEKFKDIPNKDLANIFKETKEEWCKTSKDNLKNEVKNKPISEGEKMSNAITPKTENKSVERQMDKQKQHLKLKFPLTLEGDKERDYTVTKDFVLYADYKFESLQDIEKYKQEFNKHIAELIEAFSYMG